MTRLLASAWTLALLAAPAIAQPPSAPPPPKFEDFDKVIAGAKTYEGLFKLYQKDENLYMEIRYFTGSTHAANDAVKILTYYPNGIRYREIDKVSIVACGRPALSSQIRNWSPLTLVASRPSHWRTSSPTFSAGPNERINLFTTDSGAPLLDSS